MFKQKDFDNLNSFEEIKALSPTDFELFSKFLLEYLKLKSVHVTPKQGYYGADG